MNTDNTEQKFG